MNDSKNTAVIFDEDDYYGEKGEELAKERLSEDGVEDPTESQIFNVAMQMRSESLKDTMRELKKWFDGPCAGKKSKNPNQGNHILVAGSSSRWDGTSSGVNIYSDFTEATDTSPARFRMNNIFADCEFGRIWEEDGSLYMSGYHHDGGVTVEIRQLSNEGEKLLEEMLDYEGNVDLYDLELNAMGNTYKEGDESRFVHDLWNDPVMCPVVNFTKVAFA